jgi:pimeloyl-ACP methyl ester carboxylesterase
MTTALRVRRALLVVFAVLAVVPAAAMGSKTHHHPAPGIAWETCADAEAFDCATVKVPRDYDNPRGRTLDIAATRLPAKDSAHRIGSLFVNFGGPGGDAVATLKAIAEDLFGSLNQRFDIVGFDPRGTGESSQAIDCHANQETEGVYSKPFMRPDGDAREYFNRVRNYVQLCLTNNPDIFPYVSTANVARDMDLIRRGLGEAKLNYLGFSYGTHLGATYASLFPHRYRALVLDGPVDPNQYMNKPEAALREQTAGFERAIQRFFMACAAHQDACLQFGGDDPHDAYDLLVDDLNANPRMVSDGRFVTGDDLLNSTLGLVYAKQNWPILAELLAVTSAGDAEFLRFVSDIIYGRRDDGTYDPLTDRYFTLSAAEQRYTGDLWHYFDAGDNSWGMFDHVWFNTGYVELNWGLFPITARDAYYGPFRAAADETPVLVVDTTYDPATPYRGGVRMWRQLGNARLLTMRGDGHTAYGGNSPCIDEKVEAYFNSLDAPANGTSCRQEVPFEAPAPAPAAKAAAAGMSRGALARALRRMGPGITPAVTGIGR